MGIKKSETQTARPSNLTNILKTLYLSFRFIITEQYNVLSYNNIKKSILTGSFLYNKFLAILLWFGLSTIAIVLSIQSNNINNYIIFRQSFFHLIRQTNLYNAYPSEYLDHFYYSPSFGILMAPFVLLPTKLAALLWGLLNTWSLYYAIRQIPIKQKFQNSILILSANEMMNSSSNSQSNGLLAALIILSFIYLLKKTEWKSALIITVGFFIKLYGIVGLAFFFFSKKKINFILWLIIWLVIIVLLPLILTSPTFLVQSYKDWINALILKSNFDITVNMYQNYIDLTLQGLIKRVFYLPNLSKWVVIIPGMILFATQYLRYNYFGNLTYRLYLLCSVLLFTIIFNTGAESPTYIIGIPAISLWFVLQEKKQSTNIIFIIAIFFSSFSYSDIFTPYLRNHIMAPYALKVVGCLMIWLIIVWEIFTKQFLKVDESKFVS